MPLLRIGLLSGRVHCRVGLLSRGIDSRIGLLLGGRNGILGRRDRIGSVSRGDRLLGRGNRFSPWGHGLLGILIGICRGHRIRMALVFV